MIIDKIKSEWNALDRVLSFAKQLASDICTTINPDDYHKTTQDIITLCNMLNNCDTDEFIYVECLGHCAMDELITGAYWHYTEWHGGQDSREYIALSQLGTIYNPNMETPDNDNPVYQALDDMADKYWNNINKGVI